MQRNMCNKKDYNFAAEKTVPKKTVKKEINMDPTNLV